MSAIDTQTVVLPYFRIWTCGTLRVERRIGESYQPVGTSEWGGSNYPRLILKALLCHPRRRVRREALLEMLWEEYDSEQALQNLNTGVYKLRGLLRPTKGKASLLLTSDDASWYQLADQQLLWVDADAGLLLLEQAEQAERSGQPTFLLIEQAAQYFSPGAFLEGEESLWLYGRRSTLDIARHRCLLWQATLYEQRGWWQKAQNVLLTAWQEDMSDEDILCQAMQLLHRQGMTSQALKLYRHTTEYLAQDELEPTETTKALAERLHSEVRSIELQTSVMSTHALYLPAAQRHFSFPFTSSVEQIPEATSLLSCVTMVLYRDSSKHITHLDSLQRMINQVIESWYQMETQSDEFTLSRRDALVMIAGLPLSLLVKPSTDRVSSLFIEDFLTQCTASVTACWHLMQGSPYPLFLVEEVLSAYLPTLMHLAQHPSPYQKNAAYIAAQGYLLRSLLALHRTDFAARATYCLQAIQYGKIAENRNVQVAALVYLGSTYYHEKEPAKALTTFQEAFPFIGEVSPLLGSCIHLRLAMASAQCNQHQDTLRSIALAHELFPEYPENDPSFPYLDFSQVNLSLGQGQTYLDLGVHVPESDYFEQAWNTFARVGSTVISEGIRIQIINNQAKAAVVLGDQEQFHTYLIQGIHGANILGSQKRRQEALEVYKQARTVWPNEARVNELADLFLH